MINVMKKARGRKNMKKQSCRMTQQERETHREATKLRKMTDQQLVDYVNNQKEQAGPAKDQEAVHKAEIEELEAEVAKYKAKANKAEAEARKNAENAVKAIKSKSTGGKAAVERFLQELKKKTGSGNGIGNGTIFKLKRILDTMPDDFAEKEA